MNLRHYLGGLAMKVKDLLDVINQYNSERENLFNRSADLLLMGIRNELEAIHNRGAWAEMVDVNQFGISIRKLSSDFQEFEFDISGGYLMRFGENLRDTYEMITLQEFIDRGNFQGEELNGFQGGDIRKLEPFGKALEAKGIECYADIENGQLVVAINVH